MCRSVPQMPVCSTWMSTSLMPIDGTGASSSHSPGCDFFLIRAGMVFMAAVPRGGWRRSLTYCRGAPVGSKGPGVCGLGSGAKPQAARLLHPRRGPFAALPAPRRHLFHEQVAHLFPRNEVRQAREEAADEHHQLALKRQDRLVL